MSTQNGGLIKITDLRGPTISGSVTVPLAELDQMRAEHAKALKAAQELLDNQAKVRHEYIYYEMDRNGNRSKPQETISYKGFEDFRALIAGEERNKLQNEISASSEEASRAWSERNNIKRINDNLNIQVEDLKSHIKETAKKLEKMTQDKNLFESKAEAFEETIKNLKELAEQAKEQYLKDLQELKDRNDVLTKRITKVIHTQSMGYWLWKKFEPKNKGKITQTVIEP